MVRFLGPPHYGAAEVRENLGRFGPFWIHHGRGRWPPSDKLEEEDQAQDGKVLIWKKKIISRNRNIFKLWLQDWAKIPKRECNGSNEAGDWDLKQCGQSRSPQVSNPDHITTNELTKKNFSGILGLCAFVEAFPYDVPQFLPPILMELSTHLNDPQVMRQHQ